MLNTMCADSKKVWFLKFGLMVQKLLNVAKSAFYIILIEKIAQTVFFSHQ